MYSIKIALALCLLVFGQVCLGSVESVQPAELDEGFVQGASDLEYEPAGLTEPDVFGGDDVVPENQYDWVNLFTGRYYEKPYGEINDYLASKVELPDIEENLEAAKGWLKEETSRKIVLSKRGIVEALEQFTALEKALKKQCTRISYSILFKNDKATKGKAHRPPSEIGILRRVDQIVHDVSLNHALFCKEQYPVIYENYRATMDQGHRDRVETFINLVVNEEIKGNRMIIFGRPKPKDDAEAIVLAHRIDAITGDANAKVAYDCLKEFARNDPDSVFLNQVVNERKAKPTINPEKVAKLFNKYIVESCRYYVDTMGPNVFIPMVFDMEMLEEEDRYQLEFKKYYDFYTGEVHYKLCNALLKQDRKGLMRGILRYVSKAPVVTPKDRLLRKD